MDNIIYDWKLWYSIFLHEENVYDHMKLPQKVLVQNECELFLLWLLAFLVENNVSLSERKEQQEGKMYEQEQLLHFTAIEN